LIQPKDEAELGLGPVDFPSAFAEVDRIGSTKLLVVDQRSDHDAPRESARMRRERMKAWSRA
jgi:hypothetical protein